MLRGERHDVGRRSRLVGAPLGRFGLRRTMPPQDPARQSLGNAELAHDMLDAAAATGGAQ
jgi:hypothetical protein